MESEKIRGLIADVNTKEIASHIENGNIREWCEIWRAEAYSCLSKEDAVVHAEWLDIRFDSVWRSMLATCSHCKVRGEVRVKRNECGFAVPDSDYCPNCGAKMDGERKDNG